MRKNKLYNIIFIFGFFAILLTPTYFEFFNIEGESLDNRELAVKPEFGESKFIQKWGTYYTDNYGLRNELIAAGAYVKTHLLHSSPKPKIVVYGKDNWLFYNEIDDGIFYSYSNRNLLSQDELDYFYTDYLWVKGVCRKYGVSDYFKIVWPNKHTIYPEYFSERMKMQELEQGSKREQLVELFSRKDSIRFIDPTPYLIDKKKEHQLYYKFDTHWNQLGAFYAYQEVLNKLGDYLKLKPFNLSDFELSYKDNKKGDLVSLMGLSELKSKEKSPSLRFKLKMDTIINQYEHNGVGVNDFKNKLVQNGKTLLIFGDSYVEKIQWLFLLHFERVIYVKTGFSEDLVKFFKPSIIFEAKVERYL